MSYVQSYLLGPNLMKSLSINDMNLVAGGCRVRMPFSSIGRVPLVIVGVAASVAHQVGGVISGENFSYRYLIGSALASMATTPLLADAGLTHFSLKGAVTTVYAVGFHGYVQGLVTQQSHEPLDADEGETD